MHRGDETPAYPPVDEPKPVADGIWIVDSGPLHIAGLKMPVRMTVVRLDEGGLWLHSPTRFDERLARALEALGPVRHLVAPNIAHWQFVEQWQRRFTGATVWAAPGLGQRRQVRKSGLRIDRELGEAAPEGWSAEFGQTVVAGAGGYREVAFFHKASRTLILTDLVQNLEREKLPPATRVFARLNGMLAPGGKAPLYLRAAVMVRRQQARAAVGRMIAWGPERVIFAHGRWFESDGAARLAASLRWLTG